MELSAALMLVIVFFLMLAYSVPVSYSIIASALITIIAFLTPPSECSYPPRKSQAAWTALHCWPFRSSFWQVS